MTFLYKVRTKLHIKLHSMMTHFNVLIQRKHIKTKTKIKKTSFLKETIENADLHNAVLNKTMTKQNCA